MNELHWLAAFAAALLFSYVLYCKERVRAPAWIAVLNVLSWALVGFGATGTQGFDDAGNAYTYASPGMAQFAWVMVAFGILVFVMAIFGYYDADGGDRVSTLDELQQVIGDNK